jgi:hypothetical protein
MPANKSALKIGFCTPVSFKMMCRQDIAKKKKDRSSGKQTIKSSPVEIS